jgi:hypothetical protein
MTSTPDPATFHNTFGLLADGDTSTVDSDAQPPETTLDRDDANEGIVGLFRDADATLAAATLDFNLVKERLRVRLEHDLSQTIDSTWIKIGTRMDDQLEKLLECHNSSFTAAFATLSANINSLMATMSALSTSVIEHKATTSALSARVVEHQSHLENLLSLNETRRQQMDDHVKQMGELTAPISEVKSQSTTHTQRVSAQLDGLRSNLETHTTTTKADLVDIHGRLIPTLRDKTTTLVSDVQRLEDQFGKQTSTLALKVQQLEDRLSNFDPTDLTLTVDCIEERLDALRVALEAKTSHPRRACVPPVDVSAGTDVSPPVADDAMP